MCTMQCERPPIGLKPRYIHDGQRAQDILGAIQRFLAAGKPVPGEWVDELRTLVCNELRA